MKKSETKNKSKDDGLLKPVLFKKGNGKLNKDFIKTFASTNSRFSSHNDLIQKYIYKSNFYNSLSCTVSICHKSLM